MAILDMLIERLEPAAEQATVVDVRVGAYYTVVAIHGPRGLTAGLSATLGGGMHMHGLQCAVRPGAMLDASPCALMKLVHAPNAITAAVGMATINALLEVDEKAAVEVNARQVIVERGQGKRVVIVGHFPFVPQVRKVAADLAVLELNPQEGDLPADQAARVIPQADIVAITGSSLLNHTFDDLIAMCPPEAFVLLMGGSTPMSPLFFDVGVNMVAGATVGDVPATLLTVSQGGGYREIPGLHLLTLERA